MEATDAQRLRYAADLGKLEAQRRAIRRRVEPRSGTRTVLLADDDARLRLLLATTLSGACYQVAEAPDGNAALQLLRTARPQAAILDGRMGGRTGLEVCQVIRRDPELQDLPVVILTALAEPEDEDAAMAAGADAFLTKPFGPIELLRILDTLLRRGE